MIITNNNNLPQQFVDAVSGTHAYKDKRYSVTAILKGTKEAILERRHSGETQQDASDMVWAIFGSAVHKILQEASELPEELKEEYITVDMGGGYTLSGIFDSYNATTETVTDWKTASVWKAIYDDWDDYRRQLAIYAWMLNELGFPCHKGQIVALLKDHSVGKAKRDADYPPHPVITRSFDFTDEYLTTVGEWLRAKFEDLAFYETLEDDLIPYCSDKQRWAKPEKWAVMKKGRKSAIRLYDSEEEAEARCDRENENSKGTFYVEYRPGESTKCENYCNVCQWCNFYHENVKKN